MVFRVTLALLLIGLLSLASASASQPDSDPHWAIGLQGNLPLWGGLSVKYLGLHRIHFQLIEHYVQNGDEYSAMIGLQTPFTVADYTWSRVYVAPGFGFRRTKERSLYYTQFDPANPSRPGVEVERIVTENITGGALLFGIEFSLDWLFGSDTSRYGLNVEFGQGVGQLDRQATCENLAGDPVDCEDLYKENPYLLTDPELSEGTSTRASFVVGFGFHIYF